MSTGVLNALRNGSNLVNGASVLSGSETEVADSDEENGANPRTSDLEKLQALGLTGRQAEVAFWVAQGKANNELAMILGASPRTIAHHVEAILERLGLTTRAEIMLRTLETLGWLHWPARIMGPLETSRREVGISTHIQNWRRQSQSSERRGRKK